MYHHCQKNAEKTFLHFKYLKLKFSIIADIERDNQTKASIEIHFLCTTFFYVSKFYISSSFLFLIIPNKRTEETLPDLTVSGAKLFNLSH